MVFEKMYFFLSHVKIGMTPKNVTVTLRPAIVEKFDSPKNLGALF